MVQWTIPRAERAEHKQRAGQPVQNVSLPRPLA